MLEHHDTEFEFCQTNFQGILLYYIYIKMLVCISKECHKWSLEKLPGLEAGVLIHSPVEEWVEVGVSDIQQLSYKRRLKFYSHNLLFPLGIFYL
jgi:hypothetical protein